MGTVGRRRTKLCWIKFVYVLMLCWIGQEDFVAELLAEQRVGIKYAPITKVMEEGKQTGGYF